MSFPSSLWKTSKNTFNQRTEKLDTKEKGQRRLNNNHVVIKHNQGSPAISQGLEDNILNYILWAAVDPRTPGGEVNHMMARIYPWHKLPQFWVLNSRNANKWVLGLKTNVHRTSRWHRSGPLMTNLKMTLRADCSVSAYGNTITSVYMGSAPLVEVEGGQPLGRCL